MKRIMTPLSQMGAEVVSVMGNDCAPLRRGDGAFPYNRGSSRRRSGRRFKGGGPIPFLIPLRQAPCGLGQV